jgi:hypothetical protein
MVAGFAEVVEREETLVAEACNHPNCLVLPFTVELIRLAAEPACKVIGWRLLPSRGQRGAVSGDRKQTTYAFVSWRVADNPGVDGATSGLSQVDYGAENGAGKRWV